MPDRPRASASRSPRLVRPAPARSARLAHSATRSREFDDYIAAAPTFARPVLERVRRLFHQACPDIVEALKWSHPAFEHRGIVGGMAAFKQHVRIVFWKGSLLPDPKRLIRSADGKSAGVLSVSDVKDLPPDKALLDFIRRER